MKTVYTYRHSDGRTIDLSAMLDNGYSKEEVARLAGVASRRHALIASLEAMFKAGEILEAKEIVMKSARWDTY